MARQLQAQARHPPRGARSRSAWPAEPARGGGVIDKFRAASCSRSATQNGHAVGLGGRLLEGEGPKYLNSPATPLFDKSRTLYLIDKAKGPIRKTGQAVIVEGYTDALMAHQAGFENVVASLGTALTPEPDRLLTRYAPRIALAYDVDAAGEKAGTLGVTALAGLIGQLQGDDSGVKLEDVRVVRLPDGKDPDEVIREDPAAWRVGSREAKPLVEYLIDHHARASTSRPPRAGSASSMPSCPSIRDIADPLRRDEALQQVRRVGVEERVLRQVLERRIAAAGGRPRRRGEPHHRRRRPGIARTPCPRRHPAGGHPVEAELLRLLLLLPDQQLAGRRRARAGSDCRARSRASCTGRSSSPAPPTTTASIRRSIGRPSSPASMMTRRARSPRP